jgi:hypothetical protein
MDDSTNQAPDGPDGPLKRRRTGLTVPLPAVLVGLGLATGPAVAQAQVDVALGDFFHVPSDVASFLPVTANDTFVGNTFVFCGPAPNPLHGNVSAKGSQLVYVPDAGFVGTDTFQYCARSGPLCNACATVTLAVGEVPSAVPALSSVAIAGLSGALGWLGLRARRRR